MRRDHSGPVENGLIQYDRQYYRRWMHEIPPLQHLRRATVIDVSVGADTSSLESELAKEEESLASARGALTQEQQNPTLIAAVRLAQSTNDPTPAQMMEMRSNLDKASGRIRGLQATVAEHEKNVEALKKELGALKP